MRKKFPLFKQLQKLHIEQKPWIGQKALIGIPYGWLILFFLIPFFIVLKISFAEAVIDLPPYSQLFTYGEDLCLHIKITFENYLLLFKEELYRYALLQSLTIAGISTFICLLIGYPMAYAMAAAAPKKQSILLLLVMLPFWTSFLLRVYAWMGILGNQGVINWTLMKLGITQEPILLLYSNFAIAIGMVYCYLPFMILPLYASLVKFDHTLLECAEDLGAKPIKIFFSILLPLTKTGIIAGCLFVFVPSIGEFVIPELLGPSESLMLGKMIWTEFFMNRDWPVACAIAVVMIVTLIFPMLLIHNKTSQNL